jgi:hypothetical protein
MDKVVSLRADISPWIWQLVVPQIFGFTLETLIRHL